MARPELPTSLCPYIAANQSRTATTGGDHADPVHRRDFLPAFQVMGSLDCTCEDEHTWLWHCRVTNSQCRNHPAGTFLSKCPEMCAEGLSIPGSRFGSCWESNFSSWLSYRKVTLFLRAVVSLLEWFCRPPAACESLVNAHYLYYKK